MRFQAMTPAHDFRYTWELCGKLDGSVLPRFVVCPKKRAGTVSCITGITVIASTSGLRAIAIVPPSVSLHLLGPGPARLGWAPVGFYTDSKRILYELLLGIL